MPSFGTKSLDRLATCHPKLQTLCYEVVKIFDIQVIEGHRDEASQEAAFAAGNTKVHWPNSKHNSVPSRAVDLAPYPVDWSDQAKALDRFIFMQGVVFAVAQRLGIKIRQGIDWNSNEDMRDEHGLYDRPHVELASDEP